MCRNDAPTFGQPRPNLGLASVDGAAIRCRAFEFKGNASVVSPKRDDVKAFDGACESYRGTRFTKGLELFSPVQVFGDSKTHDMLRMPEHRCQCRDVIRDESSLILRIDGRKLGDCGGVIDQHGGRLSVLPGNDR